MGDFMRIAIISGASSGIGRCITKNIDKLNLDELWLIGRNQERLVSLSAELSSKVRIFALDLTERSTLENLKNELFKNKIEVEFLIMSAGVGYNGNFEKMDLEKISNTIDLNCAALTMLTTIVLPYIKQEGKIINIASGAGFLPQPGFATYAASKAYVISFSRALRQELKSKKINVCAVCPGPVDTNFFSNLENVKEYKKKFTIQPEKVALGAIKAASKNKAIYTPTFSMKLVHFISKVIPTSFILKFYK